MSPSRPTSSTGSIVHGDAAAKFGHQGRVVPPAAGDQDAGDRGGKVDLPGGHGGGGDGGQGGGGIGVGQHVQMVEQAGEIVAVQRLRRCEVEPGIGQDRGDESLIHRPLRGERAACVMGQAKAGAHQVVQRRIGRAGVEGQKRAGASGPGAARVDPGQVADTTKVQEGDGFGRADVAGQREVVERGQRRALPAHRHVGAAEIPDGRQAQKLRQDRAVAALVGAAPARVMRQGLAVKAQNVGPGEAAEKLGMGVFHHLGGGGDAGVARPLAKGRAQGGLLIRACRGGRRRGRSLRSSRRRSGPWRHRRRPARCRTSRPSAQSGPSFRIFPCAPCEAIPRRILDRGGHELPSEI